MKYQLFTICLASILLVAVGCKKEPNNSNPTPPVVVNNSLTATVEDDATNQISFTAVDFDLSDYVNDTLTLNVFNATGDELYIKVKNVNSEQSYSLGNANEAYFIYSSDPSKKYTTAMSGGLGSLTVTDINTSDNYIDGNFTFQGFDMGSMKLVDVFGGSFRLKI